MFLWHILPLTPSVFDLSAFERSGAARNAVRMFKPQSDGARSVAHDTVHDCDGAFDVLRSRLIDVVDGKSSYDELRAPVRQLCVCAHSEDVKAEQLLVRFKEIWAELPSLSGLPRGR